MAEAAYVVLIPARLGSSRLPNKPLADLAGVPMVVRVAQQAKASAATQVVVAADHPSIVQACEQHGVEAILTRDDHPSGSDRLAEAAGLLGLSDSQIVVNVQGDEPLIHPQHIDAVVVRHPGHPVHQRHLALVRRKLLEHPDQDLLDDVGLVRTPARQVRAHDHPDLGVEEFDELHGCFLVVVPDPLQAFDGVEAGRRVFSILVGGFRHLVREAEGHTVTGGHGWILPC